MKLDIIKTYANIERVDFLKKEFAKKNSVILIVVCEDLDERHLNFTHVVNITLATSAAFEKIAF